MKELIIVGQNILSPPSSWVDTYGDYLYSFALYRVQDDSIAQDLVQDALTGALKSKNNFKGQSTEKTWLTSILKHKIIDFFRKKYSEPVLEDIDLDSTTLDDRFDARGKWKTGPAQWASNPEQLLEQKSFLDMVKKCLRELPKKQAKALALRYLEEEDSKKNCKVLNISTTNYWVILHRARSLMQKCIEINWLKKRK
ncbi:MAG: sigma-70 family RNA polymerase sigma factor [Desulfobacteraceae bacterium]|nr:sigma-70 family RNA polymerase sigma factor [Desulfobacteraceae bacterium]